MYEHNSVSRVIYDPAPDLTAVGVIVGTVDVIYVAAKATFVCLMGKRGVFRP